MKVWEGDERLSGKKDAIKGTDRTNLHHPVGMDVGHLLWNI